MYLMRGDRQLFYRLDGAPEGRRLVLLNSLGTSTASWNGVVEHLASDFCILRIDKAGHGGSAPWAGARRIADNADDVLAVLEHLGWSGVDICGISIGGMTAIELAARQPRAVDRLVLSNTSAHVPPEGLSQRIATIQASGLPAVAEMAVGRFLSPGRAHAGYPAYVAALADFNAVDAESYIGWCQAIIAMDLRPLLPKIAARSLVINGTWDVATPPEWGEAVAAGLPNARLIELPTGHLPFLDEPKQYAEIVRRFLHR
jgi:3-oxoadipate enol-lactonase